MTITKKAFTNIDQDLNCRRLNYIGQYLKQLRLYEGFTQHEAASRSGISRNCLQNAEHGHNITILTIFKLVDFYDLSASELFTELE